MIELAINPSFANSLASDVVRDWRAAFDAVYPSHPWIVMMDRIAAERHKVAPASFGDQRDNIVRYS